MSRKQPKRPIVPLGDPHDPQGMGVLLEKFFEWMLVKNYSELTIDVQRMHVAIFIQWAAERGIVRPSEVTKPILERYQRYLYHYRKQNGDALSYYSQRNRLAPLRTWFKWLARHNHILYNPASELELPKLEKRLPKHVLTAEEAEQVINLPNVAEPLGVRDRAILETLYSTGIRRLELIGLRLYDLDAGSGTVFVRLGKGKKDRMVPIGERALGWLDRYLREVRPCLLIGDTAGDAVFLTNVGEPFTASRLSGLVREYVTAAQLRKRGSCHLFRHTMATLMLENGADIRYIQAMLGHASLETTQIYAQVSIRKLKEIHAATHPAKPKRSPSP